MTAATTRVTRNGQTLTARHWALLEDAYKAAGLDPASHLYVTKGSWKETTASSGSTHNGAGACDLRVWILPESAQANLCRTLVVELRKRNCCAWFRDQAHGGFDPHVHVIVRDEPGISDAAAWQCSEYDAGRNGLTNGDADYHPRPKQSSFVYVPPGQKSFVTVTGRSAVGPRTAAAKLGISVARLLWFNPSMALAPKMPGDKIVVPPGVTPVPVYAGK